MFVGHGLAAFAVVAAVASRRWSAERALRAGVVAGAFATVPDTDMLFAALAGLAAGPTGDATAAFWAATAQLHRSVTHSLVVGVPAALAFGGWRRGGPWRVAGAAVGAGLVAAVGVVGGPLAAGMLAATVAAGLAVTTLSGLSARALTLAALVGFCSHPFGDLFAGGPPALLYPLPWRLLEGPLQLAADPTVHLLGAFLLELATVWLALVVYCRLRGRRLGSVVRPRAALGVGYAGAALVVPAPTVEVASPFVFSVLSVGVVGLPTRWRRGGRPSVDGAAALGTALGAVTLAALAYAGVYLLA